MAQRRRRSPYKLRADGKVKGMYLLRTWALLFGDRAPSMASAERTRSKRWLAGTRRTKKFMRKAASR